MKKLLLSLTLLSCATQAHDITGHKITDKQAIHVMRTCEFIDGVYASIKRKGMRDARIVEDWWIAAGLKLMEKPATDFVVVSKIKIRDHKDNQRYAWGILLTYICEGRK